MTGHEVTGHEMTGHEMTGHEMTGTCDGCVTGTFFPERPRDSARPSILRPRSPHQAGSADTKRLGVSPVMKSFSGPRRWRGTGIVIALSEVRHVAFTGRSQARPAATRDRCGHGGRNWLGQATGRRSGW